jgi:hypothetical protein
MERNEEGRLNRSADTFIFEGHAETACRRSTAARSTGGVGKLTGGKGNLSRMFLIFADLRVS